MGEVGEVLAELLGILHMFLVSILMILTGF